MEEYQAAQPNKIEAISKVEMGTKSADLFECLPQKLAIAYRETRQGQSILQINSSHNYHAHQCSYSKVDKGSTSCGFSASQVSPLDYNDLMDRGFRRCGDYFYRQDNTKNHWPYYTIRADATQHRIRKSHQKAWGRWQRYLQGKRDVIEPDDELEETPNSTQTCREVAQADPELLEQAQHRVQAGIEPIYTELCNILKEKAQILPELPNPVEFKTKITVSADKQNAASVFSNLLVLICGQLKLPAKEIVKAKTDFLHGIMSLPIAKLEILPGGLLRWTKSDISKMEEEKLHNSNQANPQKSKKASKIGAAQAELPKMSPKKLEIKLVPAVCTTENFELYQRYCDEIHKSKKDQQSSYENFLCKL